MKVLLIDNGTSILEKLEALIPGVEIVKKWNDPSLRDVAGFDLIILSGSSEHSLIEDSTDFKDEIELIRSANKPIIGICFGCELIALAFGGKLRKLPIKHKGIRIIDIIDPNFYNKKSVSIYENHRVIIDVMPKEFKILAQSVDGPEAIKHLSLPIYGLQFHPESFVDETHGDEIFKKLFSQFTK